MARLNADIKLQMIEEEIKQRMEKRAVIQL